MPTKYLSTRPTMMTSFYHGKLHITIHATNRTFIGYPRWCHPTQINEFTEHTVVWVQWIVVASSCAFYIISRVFGNVLFIGCSGWTCTRNELITRTCCFDLKDEKRTLYSALYSKIYNCLLNITEH